MSKIKFILFSIHYLARMENIHLVSVPLYSIPIFFCMIYDMTDLSQNAINKLR